MRLHKPFEALTPTLDGDVLLVLARAEASFTGGQLARMIPDASEDGVRRAAQRLVAQGLVLMERVGQAHNYSLNRDHLLAEPVIAIARARETLTERLRDHVAGWVEQPEAIVLFGSAARGEMNRDSDIDLLVVGEGSDRWDDQLLELALAVRRWTGNDARLLVMSPDEVETGLGVEPVLHDIMHDGQILSGPAGWLQNRRARSRLTTTENGLMRAG